MIADSLGQNSPHVGSATTAGKQSPPSAADNPTTRSSTRKKSGRSQSPQAMERRRLQNMIAQRNHRRRLKERTAAGNTHGVQESQGASVSQPASSDSNSSNSNSNTLQLPSSSSSSSSSSSPLLSSQNMDTTFLTGELNKPGAPLGLDSMMPQMMEDNSLSSIAGLDLFPVPSACTCNTMTGPCATHLEEIRSQVLKSPMATRNSQSVPRPKTSTDSSYQETSVQPANYMDSNTNNMELDSSQDSRSQQPLSSTAGNGSSNVARPMPSPVMSGTKPSKPIDDTVNPSADSTISNAVVQNTARFKTILEVVHAAGFADFDRMAGAYYTAEFEKNSLPEITQRASRGWRLNKLLQDLHECSRHWSPWESRGLREGVVESATMECIDEIDRIAGGHLEGRARDSDSINAFMDTKGSTAIGPLDRLPALPDLMDNTVQDEAPYLWNLVTELAGPQSIYCNRISHEVLALLADARRSQYF